MSHPLDGARLKIVRAQEHLETLKCEIIRYIDSHPQSVIPVKNDDDTWGVDAKIISQTEPRLSTIIGDCIGNARATLDYIMWELSGTYAKRVLLPPPWGKDKPYFPIYERPEGFEKCLPSLSKFMIPDSIISKIREVQPYNAGYFPLWYLHILVNTDKHRFPLLVLGSFDTIELSIEGPVHNANFPIKTTGISARPRPQVQTQSTVFVAWQDISMPNEPVERTLQNIVECVARIIPSFDSFVL